MGQQQLHLIVLGVILVFFSIAVGVASFSSNSLERNRDAVISDLNSLSMLARGYYKKSEELGGGNYAFTGYDIPGLLEENENGNYRIISVRSQEIIFQGTGIEKDGSSGCSQSEFIQYNLIVTLNNNELVKVN